MTPTPPPTVPPGSRHICRISFGPRPNTGAVVYLDGHPKGRPYADPNGTHDYWQAPNGETHYTDAA